MIRNLVVIIFTAMLVNNYVLVKFLGICPFLGVSKKLHSAVGMGLAVTFVMLLATAATWPLHTYLLTAFHLEYLQTIVFILIIAALVQLAEIILKRYLPALHRSLGIYLPLITTNCAVLGLAKNNITEGYELFIEAMANGLGFLLAMVLFAGVRMRIETAKPPKCFEGMPITLISASIVALAFYGFAGVIDNMFV